MTTQKKRRAHRRPTDPLLARLAAAFAAVPIEKHDLVVRIVESLAQVPPESGGQARKHRARALLRVLDTTMESFR